MKILPVSLLCGATLFALGAATDAPAQDADKATDSAGGATAGTMEAGAAAGGEKKGTTEASVSDLAEQGIAAEKAGDLEQAIAQFQKAIAQMQERIGARMARRTPKPLEGWEALGKPQVRTMSSSSGKTAMATTTVQQNYRRKADGVTFRFNYSNAPQYAALAQQIRTFRNNKMILEQMNKAPNRSVEIFEDGEWLAMLDHNGKRVTLNAFRKSNVFQLRLNAGEVDTMKNWWKAIDKK